MLNETQSVDAARLASFIDWTGKLNGLINWELIGPLLFVFFILFCVGLWNRGTVLYFWAKLPFSRWRESRRMKIERKKELSELIADCYTDAVEELYHCEAITKRERAEMYLRVGKLGYPDLLHEGQRLMAEERAAMKRDITGKVIPIEFPDSKEEPAKLPAHVHIL